MDAPVTYSHRTLQATQIAPDAHHDSTKPNPKIATRLVSSPQSQHQVKSALLLDVVV